METLRNIYFLLISYCLMMKDNFKTFSPLHKNLTTSVEDNMNINNMKKTDAEFAPIKYHFLPLYASYASHVHSHAQ